MMGAAISQKSQARKSLAERLPAFPWDSLQAAKALASSHQAGMVDLSVGTPVDETPFSAQNALAAASDAHGYPSTQGSKELSQALLEFVRRNLINKYVPEEIALSEANILPTVGSKEFVAHLPFQLGIGEDASIAFPQIAYPTYDMGARFVGAKTLPLDLVKLAEQGEKALAGLALEENIQLLWLNTPSNPTGQVLRVEQLKAIVDFARANQIIVASDECYALLSWGETEVASILDPRVNGGDLSGLLCVYSLSKQSNLAGYRAAFVAGCAELVGELLAVRKQAGMMMPQPIQAAMTAALADESAVKTQKEVYFKRREKLKEAILAAGGKIEHSEAGLYLWANFASSSDETVDALAKIGILVAPGHFYGTAGEGYVRIALTASDEKIAQAAERLSRVGSLFSNN